jgi:hypothetical protein
MIFFNRKLKKDVNGLWFEIYNMDNSPTCCLTIECNKKLIYKYYLLETGPYNNFSLFYFVNKGTKFTVKIKKKKHKKARFKIESNIFIAEKAW